MTNQPDYFLLWSLTNLLQLVEAVSKLSSLSWVLLGQPFLPLPLDVDHSRLLRRGRRLLCSAALTIEPLNHLRSYLGSLDTKNPIFVKKSACDHVKVTRLMVRWPGARVISMRIYSGVYRFGLQEMRQRLKK